MENNILKKAREISKLIKHEHITEYTDIFFYIKTGDLFIEYFEHENLGCCGSVGFSDKVTFHSNSFKALKEEFLNNYQS